MPRVCHISTVHDWFDNRIFQKECRSLRAAGYDVTWVVQHSHNETRDGVEIVALDKPKSRSSRWAWTGWQAFKKAIRSKADIYHFHDPELIPQGILLRLLGHPVIYDIHEDYVSSISQKHYLPESIRNLLSKVAGLAESLSSRQFIKIIAEQYYAERFPDAVKVLNYPEVPEGDPARCVRSTQRLLYTGKVHEARGAKIHASLPRLVPDVTVHFVGKCSRKLHQSLLSDNRDHSEKLSFEGVGYSVPFEDIRNTYSGNWLAGIAIFPPNEHLERKELTKFFEYMLHGIPIIASNFPAWRNLIEQHRCGICVDPSNEAQIVDAIRTLQNDEALWAEFSRNGVEAVQQHFSWSSQEEILLDLYRQIIGNVTSQT